MTIYELINEGHARCDRVVTEADGNEVTESDEGYFGLGTQKPPISSMKYEIIPLSELEHATA